MQILDTKRFYFNSSRKCYNPHLSEVQNLNFYGLRSYPRGVNFFLDVTRKLETFKEEEKNQKEREKREGAKEEVRHCDSFDKFFKKERKVIEKFIQSLDKKCLNIDVLGLKNKILTDENLVFYCFSELQREFSFQPFLKDSLLSLKLKSSRNSWVEYVNEFDHSNELGHSDCSYDSKGSSNFSLSGSGSGSGKFLVTRSYRLSCLHKHFDSDLSPEENKKLYGKCFKTHGHDYQVEVTLDGRLNLETGLIIRYGDMDQIVEESILKPYHKTDLNEAFGNTSGEIIVEKFYLRLKEAFLNYDPLLKMRLNLRETQKNAFEYGDLRTC